MVKIITVTGFELLEVQVPLIFLGMEGFSLRREGVSGLMWKRGDDGGRGAAM